MGQVAPALWEVLEGFPMGGFQGLRGLEGALPGVPDPTWPTTVTNHTGFLGDWL